MRRVQWPSPDVAGLKGSSLGDGAYMSPVLANMVDAAASSASKHLEDHMVVRRSHSHCDRSRSERAREWKCLRRSTGMRSEVTRTAKLAADPLERESMRNRFATAAALPDPAPPTRSTSVGV